MQLRKLDSHTNEQQKLSTINSGFLNLIHNSNCDILIISIGSCGSDRQQQIPDFAVEYANQHSVEVINIDPAFTIKELGTFKIDRTSSQLTADQLKNLTVHYHRDYFFKTLTTETIFHKPLKLDYYQKADFEELKTLSELLLQKLNSTEKFRIIFIDNTTRQITVSLMLLATNLCDYINHRVEVVSSYYQNSDCLIFNKEYFNRFDMYCRNRKEFLTYEKFLVQKILKYKKWDFELKLQLVSGVDLLENAFWKNELSTNSNFREDYNKLRELRKNDKFLKFETICAYRRCNFYGQFERELKTGCQGTTVHNWDVSKFKELAHKNFNSKIGMHIPSLANITPNIMFLGNKLLSISEFDNLLDQQIKISLLKVNPDNNLNQPNKIEENDVVKESRHGLKL